MAETSNISRRARMTAGEQEQERRLRIALSIQTPGDLHNLPPGSGTSVALVPSRWARLLAWLAAMTIVAGCNGPMKRQGISSAASCTLMEDGNRLTCIEDGRAYLCVRDWDRNVIVCAPYPGQGGSR